MNIGPADIAALEKILDWAQGAMLDEQKAAAPAEVPAEPMPEEPAEEMHAEEPALEIEIGAEPKASALKSFRIGGQSGMGKKPEAFPPKKQKRGRY
jgi:hypothetical protein